MLYFKEKRNKWFHVRAEVDRLQSGLERERVRGYQKCSYSADAVVEARHSHVQQVRLATTLFLLLVKW